LCINSAILPTGYWVVPQKLGELALVWTFFLVLVWETHPEVCPNISDTPVYLQIVSRDKETSKSNTDLKEELVINV
jgi:hypothetical protein